MSAQQYAVVNVCRPVVTIPPADVMGLSPFGWPFAAGPTTSAITRGEHAALCAAEVALCASKVDWLSAVVEDDLFDAAAAGVSFDGGDGDGQVLTFDPPAALSSLEILRGDEHAHGRLVHTYDRCRVSFKGTLEQFEKCVRGELFGRAVIALDRFGDGASLLGDESRSSATRRGDLVVDIVDEGGPLGVEYPDVACHALWAPPPAKGSQSVTLALALNDAGRIQFVARIAGHSQHLIGVDGSARFLRHGRDEVLCCFSKIVDAHARTRCAETVSDRIGRRNGEASGRNRATHHGEPSWFPAAGRVGIIEHAPDAHQGAGFARGRSGDSLHECFGSAKALFAGEAVEPGLNRRAANRFAREYRCTGVHMALHVGNGPLGREQVRVVQFSRADSVFAGARCGIRQHI